MDGQSRRSRFETRVRTERDFLGAINRVFGAIAPLAGMTHDAIGSWSRRASEATGVDLTAVVAVLFEASSRADLMADNSKDVFDTAERPAPDSIAELRALLAIALSSPTVSDFRAAGAGA
jgi:hypothetical protein